MSTTGKRKGPKETTLDSKKDNQHNLLGLHDMVLNSMNQEAKVYLAKIGDIKIRLSRPLPSEPSSATIIKDAANRYFISFVVETSAEPHLKLIKSRYRFGYYYIRYFIYW